MIDVQTTDFDPSQTNEIYEEMSESWELNQDFAEMHLATLRAGTHLDTFGDKSSEPASQYAKRRLWSFALDHCQDLIGLRVDNLFRSPPVRKYEKSPFAKQIEAFLSDVDGGGTDMDSFMRRALVGYYTNGVDIIVDKQSTDALPANQAQEDALGLRSYVHAFSPLDRVDWAVDHAGRYIWARYSLGELPATDELAGLPGFIQYLTLTADEWRLYNVPTDGSGASTVVSAPHSLGICPIVPFYFKKSARLDYPQVPLSLLTRIAPIARYLLNLISQIQLDIYRNIGFMVATGVKASEIPTEITPMGCWALPEGATLESVSGPVAHIKEKREFANMLIEAILRIGKLAGHSGELQARATSGVQVAVERTDIDNEMQMTAAQAEGVEQEIVRMAMSRNIGKPITVEQLGFSVEYNTRFVLTGVSEIIGNIKSLIETDTHVQVPEPLRIMMRQLVAALTNEDDEAYAEAMAQIAAIVPDALVSAKTKGPLGGGDTEGGDVDNLIL